ncbi:12S rRNA N4-methylcytidine methyltransferase-like isoform X2 [Ornithodoros turicata]|uniref:12S rRNA N4-methylcytidine methyltransferase-like isoform X2 n=1 Tax=Ornithodoros turicata TaxID=34597 RepID=UPI003139E776
MAAELFFRLQRLNRCTSIAGSRRLSNIAPNEQLPDLSHRPVMLREIIQHLNVKDNQTFIDFTFGAGGHTRKILKSAQNVRVYGIDRDPLAYRMASAMSEEFPNRLIPLLARFSEAESLLMQHGVQPNSVDGAILDCGCSSMQFDDPSRGFSLSRDGPLDMRMDRERYPDEPTAADVVNSLDAESLARIFKVYGEEKKSKKVAQAIIDSRFMMKRIATTWELAEVVGGALSERYERHDKLQRPAHSATKVFMALRIFVNNELNELSYALHVASRLLKPGARMLVLSFHSLEDRVVKRHFQDVDIDEPVSTSISQKYRNATKWHNVDEMEKERIRVWQPVKNARLILPTDDEVYENPRSRSAKLRVAEKAA